MADIAFVRAEIKTWERSFKEKNARDPTIKDIKDRPDIAERYKLYKRMNKAAASSQGPPSQTARPAPSTPPRSTHRGSQDSVLSKPRTVQMAAPLLTHNPFSPQKGKGKQQASSLPRISKVRTNLFGTPKPSTSKRQPSPDLFPPLPPPESQTFTRGTSRSPTRTPKNALARARKRLRGEPVSPSPMKEKRRRVDPLPPTYSPPRPLGIIDDFEVQHTSFITDSPVKASRSQKPFQLLFNEPATSPSFPHGGSPSEKPTVKPSASGIFESSIYTKTEPGPRIAGNSLLAPRKSKQVPQSDPALLGTLSDIPPVKDLLSDSEMEVVRDAELSQVDALLPPSPQEQPRWPTVSSNASRGQPKGSKRASTNKRKLKTTLMAHQTNGDEDDNEDSEPLTINIKFVNRHAQSPGSTVDDHDSDALFVNFHPVGPRGEGPSSHNPPEVLTGNDWKLEVDLPEKLQRVLALDQTQHKEREVKEERVVKRLLYGRRVNYDPSKGGEVWDVGEDLTKSENDRNDSFDMEAEDDWEGEPIPWEVGEL